MTSDKRKIFKIGLSETGTTIVCQQNQAQIDRQFRQIAAGYRQSARSPLLQPVQ